MSLDIDEARAVLSLEALEQGNEIAWIAIGDSMWPSIPSGSRVLIAPLSPYQVRCGEVGLFVTTTQSELVWVLHRVVRNDVKARLLYTRGDHLPLADLPYSYDQWRGVLKSIAHKEIPYLSNHLLNQNLEKKIKVRVLRKCWTVLGTLSYQAHCRDAQGYVARALGLCLSIGNMIYSRLRS